MSRVASSLVPRRIRRQPTAAGPLAVLALATGLTACGSTTDSSGNETSNLGGTTGVSPSSDNTSAATTTQQTTTAPTNSSTGNTTTTSTTSTATSSAPTATNTGTTSTAPTSSAATTSADDTATSSTSAEESSTSGETTSSEPTSDGEGSPGCGSTPPASGRFEIDVNGEKRVYIIAIPDNYEPGKPYRLVFTWHPWGGSAEQVAGSGGRGYYGLQAEAKGEAIFVSPDGLDFGGNGKGWGNENGKDLAFFDAMVERFENELCIDKSRIFSTGFSFGGMMSWALGCGRGDVVRAIAPMAGNISVAGCLDGDNPVAVMGFHGVDDNVVAISGGQAGRDKFIDRNNCGEPKPSDSNWCSGANSDPCTCTTYDGCDEGYPVTWCEFKGTHTPAPNSAATIWNFFAGF